MSDDAQPTDPLLIRPDHCVAVRSQLEVYNWESDLVAQARAKHPTVAWWWGGRITEWRALAKGANTPGARPDKSVKYPTKYGAFCYVCDTLIVTWARNFPMTERAKNAVEAHKQHHHVQAIRPAVPAGK